MDFEFSVTGEPAAVPDFSVRCIYHVLADSGYDVRRDSAAGTGYIAIRTFGGEGELLCTRCSSVNVRAGSLIVLPYNRLERYRCSGYEWVFWWFHFDAAAQLPIETQRKYVINEVSSEQSMCREAVKKLSSRESFDRASASIIFARLYSIWFDLIRDGNEPYGSTRPAVENAIEYMHSRYNEVLTVGELAAVCNLSVRRFQDLFQEHTGAPPSKYLSRLRLSAVKEYLANTNLSVKEIASRTGFCNEYYLSRCFSRENGMPPGKFRKQMLRPDPRLTIPEDEFV